MANHSGPGAGRRKRARRAQVSGCTEERPDDGGLETPRLRVTDVPGGTV